MNEPNIITIQANGGSYYKQDVILNAKECQLLQDKANPNETWDLFCESIEAREGIVIQGNYQLISYRIDGIIRPLH